MKRDIVRVVLINWSAWSRLVWSDLSVLSARLSTNNINKNTNRPALAKLLESQILNTGLQLFEFLYLYSGGSNLQVWPSFVSSLNRRLMISSYHQIRFGLVLYKSLTKWKWSILYLFWNNSSEKENVNGRKRSHFSLAQRVIKLDIKNKNVITRI